MSESIRAVCVEELGAKCANCGWAEDARVLAIVAKEGTTRTERDKQTRDRYFAKVMRHPERYMLLCANCRFVRMYAKQDEARYLRERKRTFVWQPPDEMTGVMGTTYPWLDKEVEAGHIVVVVTHRGVYSYPSYDFLADRWDGYAEANRLGALPVTATGFVS